MQIILDLIFGLILGTITGLFPGIHINLISTLIINYLYWLQTYFSKLDLFFVILSMSITHTFLDSFPSILLGIPDSTNIFLLLPGHRLVVQGKAKKAIFLTLLGSLFGGIIAGLFALILLMTLKIPLKLNPKIKFLVLISITIFISIKHKFSIIAITSYGLLGWLTLNSNTFHLSNPFFHLFSGLFALTSSIEAIKNKSYLPKQKNLDLRDIKIDVISILITNVIAIITLIFPGISSSLAIALLLPILNPKDEKYLLITGATNTATIILSLAIYLNSGYKRNGTIIALTELVNKNEIYKLYFIIIAYCICISIVAYFYGLILMDFIIPILNRVNYQIVSFVIISIIISLSFVFDRFFGWLALSISCLVGYINIYVLKIPRYFAMLTIIIPVIFYYLNYLL